MLAEIGTNSKLFKFSKTVHPIKLWPFLCGNSFLQRPSQIFPTGKLRVYVISGRTWRASSGVVQTCSRSRVDSPLLKISTVDGSLHQGWVMAGAEILACHDLPLNYLCNFSPSDCSPEITAAQPLHNRCKIAVIFFSKERGSFDCITCSLDFPYISIDFIVLWWTFFFVIESLQKIFLQCGAPFYCIANIFSASQRQYQHKTAPTPQQLQHQNNFKN